MSDKTGKEPSAIVISFGKHKGQTVAELLATDPQYADWLMGQEWLAQRFAEPHAAISTRGAGTDDTPEHNALQARFLSNEFRIAFLLATCADSLSSRRDAYIDNYAEARVSRDRNKEINIKEPLPPAQISSFIDVVQLAAANRHTILHAYLCNSVVAVEFEPPLIRLRFEQSVPAHVGRQLEALLSVETGADWTVLVETNLPSTPGQGWRTDVEAHRASRQAALKDARDAHNRDITTRFEQAKEEITKKIGLFTRVRAFEHRGIDVIVEWEYETSLSRGQLERGLAIEIKPSLGDDYPTVIRQMKRLGASYLLVGAYAGAAVPLEELKEMFAISDIMLVMLQEVDAEIANARALIATE